MGLKSEVIRDFFRRLRKRDPNCIRYETTRKYGGGGYTTEEQCDALVVELDIAARAMPGLYGSPTEDAEGEDWDETEAEAEEHKKGKMDTGRKLYGWFRSAYLRRVIPGNRSNEASLAPGEYCQKPRVLILVSDNKNATPRYKDDTAAERADKARKDFERLQVTVPNCPESIEDCGYLDVNDDFCPPPSIINCSPVLIYKVKAYLLQCVVDEFHDTPGLWVYATCPTRRSAGPRAPPMQEASADVLVTLAEDDVRTMIDVVTVKVRDGVTLLTSWDTTGLILKGPARDMPKYITEIEGKSTLGLNYDRVHSLLNDPRTRSVRMSARNPAEEGADLWLTHPGDIITATPDVTRKYKSGENIKISRDGPDAPPHWTGSGEGEIIANWWSSCVCKDTWGFAGGIDWSVKGGRNSMTGNRLVSSIDQDNIVINLAQPRNFVQGSFLRLKSMRMTRQEYDELVGGPYAQPTTLDEWGMPSAGTHRKRPLPPASLPPKKAPRKAASKAAPAAGGWLKKPAGQSRKDAAEDEAGPPKITVRVYVDLERLWVALHGNDAEEPSPSGMAVLTTMVACYSDYNVKGIPGVGPAYTCRTWDLDSFMRHAHAFQIDPARRDWTIDNQLRPILEDMVRAKRKTGVTPDEWKGSLRQVAHDVFWNMVYWMLAFESPGWGISDKRLVLA
jgi:hypothetical protein